MLDTARSKNIDGRWETNVGDISLVSYKLEFGTARIAAAFRPQPLLAKEGRPDSKTVRKGWLHARYAASPSVNARRRDTYHSNAKA